MNWYYIYLKGNIKNMKVWFRQVSKELITTIYINKVHFPFLVAQWKTPKLSVFSLKQFYIGQLLVKFHKNHVNENKVC